MLKLKTELNTLIENLTNNNVSQLPEILQKENADARLEILFNLIDFRSKL